MSSYADLITNSVEINKPYLSFTDKDAITKQYVDVQVAGLVSSAPEVLNTLKELATALGDDPNLSSTLASLISTEATSRTSADTTLQANIQSEASTRAASDATLQTQVTQQQRWKSVTLSPQNHPNVYADGSPPLVPVDALKSEQGWYYKKSDAVGNKKHNWYVEVPANMKFGEVKTMQLLCKIANLSPLQTVSELPFFGFYTKPKGDGKDRSSWYRSRVTFTNDYGSGGFGGKYSFSFKIDPTREYVPSGDYAPVEFAQAPSSLLSLGSSQLSDIANEDILSIHVSSGSTAAITQEYFIHSLHMQLPTYTTSYVFNGNDVCDDDKIKTSQNNLTIESSTRSSAVSVLQSQIDLETSTRAAAVSGLETLKLDKSDKYSKDKDGFLTISETAYLYIGTNWRIAANNGATTKRLEFQYSNDGNVWALGIPFIR